MAKRKNPFVIQGYQGAAYFCDREKELELLIDHVTNDRNFTLYGWRRLGKTALLHHLAHRLKLEFDIKTVFIDVSACRDFNDFTLKTIDAVFDEFGKTSSGSIKKSFQRIIGALGLSMSFNPQNGLPSFSIRIDSSSKKEEQPSLHALFQFLETLTDNVMLVFDEFQQVEHFQNNTTEAHLRHLSQQFPNIRFAFSGSHRGIMQSMFSAHHRPFYKSTQLVDLTPIKEEYYSRFIIEKFQQHNKTINASLTRNIYHWCRGETYSIQLICNRLFGRYKNPTDQDLQAIQQQILLEQKRAFTEWLNLLPYNQVKVLRAIAEGEPVESPTANTFVQQHNLGASSSVQTALNGLIKKEIIFKENNRYYVHDVLFSKWLNMYFH